MLERCYQGKTDQALMLELVHRNPAENLHVVDLPYRLGSWALREPENARLWFDEAGILRAWAVLQPPFSSIDYAFDPATDRNLHCQILDWAVERALTYLGGNPDYGQPSWYIEVLDGETERMEDLMAKGFADQVNVPVDPWSEILMTRLAGTFIQEKLLPPGYELRMLNGQDEVAAYVTLHQAVFQTKNMTEDWRSQVILQPAYQPELDLVIEAPDSSLAAFCIGWFDPAGYAGRLCGQIEPLGVSELHRGLGLAKILLNECFRRLYALGAEQIYVETSNFRDEALALYESIGFQVLHLVHVFRKDFYD